MSDPTPRVAIVGLGSVLMGDDAAGPYFIRLLESAYHLPEEVVALDLGTPGPDLVTYIRGFEDLIVIDTVKSDGLPGELRLYGRDEILAAPLEPRLSPHEPGLREGLLAAEMADSGPGDVLLIGVIPERVELNAGLSDTVQAALVQVERIVVGRLLASGIRVVERAERRPPDIWWERPTA